MTAAHQQINDAKDNENCDTEAFSYLLNGEILIT